MNATTNGRARKSLAEQIDQLDQTLDGLAEGLNEAVASAVREAVQGVLAEFLADAGLRSQLRALLSSPTPAAAPAAPTPAPAPMPNRCRRAWQGLAGRLQAIRQALRGVAVRTGQTCRRQWERLTGTCSRTWQRVGVMAVTGWHGLQFVRHVLLALGTALAVGGLVSVAAYFAGPTLAAAASGVCGFVTTLAVRTAFGLRRTFLPIPFGEG